MKKSKIVVVSGMSGSGKSTIVEGLLKKFPQSNAISFDDYDIDALPSAPDIATPIEEAVNQYDMRTLLADLEKIAGDFPYLFLDFPFGYKHEALKERIDLVIYVKTPLDVCLARRIVRDSYDSVEAVQEMAATYLNFGRQIFIDYEAFISQEADLIIDGTLSINENLETISALIK